MIGAGPAGLSAALTAIELRKPYLCIEQNSFGGTVYHFPRQKVVMTYPAILPGVGEMKFKSNKASKEDLLNYWQEIRQRKNLKVEENTRFENLQKVDGGFIVQTNRGPISAQKVILALGVRGSPRKLGVPGEDLPKVTYNLVDPAQYQGRIIAVVGGGNAGVEAAQYLAKREYGNRVHLLVRGTTFDRCNEENQKIIYQREKEGLVKIHFETSVKKVEAKALIVENRTSGTSELKNDFIFVFAGAESPHQFLMGLGIEIDKKFAEALK